MLRPRVRALVNKAPNVHKTRKNLLLLWNTPKYRTINYLREGLSRRERLVRGSRSDSLNIVIYKHCQNSRCEHRCFLNTISFLKRISGATYPPHFGRNIIDSSLFHTSLDMSHPCTYFNLLGLIDKIKSALAFLIVHASNATFEKAFFSTTDFSFSLSLATHPHVSFLIKRALCIIIICNYV